LKHGTFSFSTSVLKKGTGMGLYKLCSTMVFDDIIHQFNDIFNYNT
jgi:hypothetical protein